jgi:hypothetical protein
VVEILIAPRYGTHGARRRRVTPHLTVRQDYTRHARMRPSPRRSSVATQRRRRRGLSRAAASQLASARRRLSSTVTSCNAGRMRLPQRSSIPCASAKHGSGKAPESGALRRYSPSKFGDRGRGPWSGIAVTRYHNPGPSHPGRCSQAQMNVCRQQGNGVCVLLLIPYLLPAAPNGNGTPALLVSRSEISDATSVNPIQPQTAPRHLSTAEHSPPHFSTACPSTHQP